MAKNALRKTNVARLKSYLNNEDVQKRFMDLMDKQEANQFMASLINAYSTNDYLQKCDPVSVIGASLVAGALNLPINPNLGFAYIIPYGKEAQFQMGYKGMIQLALRTGQYLRLNVVVVCENQFESYNELTEELICDFSKEGDDNIAGYVGYLKLINGFEKTVYWSKEKVKKHAMKYSQAYKKGFNSPWKSNFDSMGMKTVLKAMLSKWGIMSTQMQTAQLQDQKIFKSIDDASYNDNPENNYNPEKEESESVKAFNKAKEDAEDVDVDKKIDDESDLEGTPMGKPEKGVKK